MNHSFPCISKPLSASQETGHNHYSVHITATAERDMAQALNHIEFALKNQDASNNLLNEAESKINSLSSFPEKFSLVDDPLLASWGIRFIQIKNYLAFYIIFKEERKVNVIRFLYGKSNWSFILKRGFSLN